MRVSSTTLTKLMMLPEHALSGMTPKELATGTWWSTTPIGTGPFKFKQYVSDQYVELAADDDYRGGAPKADRLINRYFENPAAAVAALRAGEIQFTYVESDDVATFKDDNGFQVIEGAVLCRQLSRLQPAGPALEGRARAPGGHARHRPQGHHREPLRRRCEPGQLRLCRRAARA